METFSVSIYHLWMYVCILFLVCTVEFGSSLTLLELGCLHSLFETAGAKLEPLEMYIFQWNSPKIKQSILCFEIFIKIILIEFDLLMTSYLFHIWGTTLATESVQISLGSLHQVLKF